MSSNDELRRREELRRRQPHSFAYMEHNAAPNPNATTGQPVHSSGCTTLQGGQAFALPSRPSPVRNPQVPDNQDFASERGRAARRPGTTLGSPSSSAPRNNTADPQNPFLIPDASRSGPTVSSDVRSHAPFIAPMVPPPTTHSRTSPDIEELPEFFEEDRDCNANSYLLRVNQRRGRRPFRNATQPRIFQIGHGNGAHTLRAMPENAISFATWNATRLPYPNSDPQPLALDNQNLPPQVSTLHMRSIPRRSEQSPALRDVNGNPRVSGFGRTIYDVPGLPQTLPYSIDGSWISYWSFSNQNLMMADITDRVRYDDHEIGRRLATGDEETQKELAEAERNRMSQEGQRWRGKNSGVFDPRKKGDNKPSPAVLDVTKRRIHPLSVLHNTVWDLHWAPADHRVPHGVGRWLIQQNRHTPFYEARELVEPEPLLRWIYQHAGFRLPTLREQTVVEAMRLYNYNPYRPDASSFAVDPDWVDETFCNHDVLSTRDRDDIQRRSGLYDVLQDIRRRQTTGPVVFVGDREREQAAKRRRVGEPSAPAVPAIPPRQLQTHHQSGPTFRQPLQMTPATSSGGRTGQPARAPNPYVDSWEAMEEARIRDRGPIYRPPQDSDEEEE